MVLEKPTYFENLDGLRAVAALSVIFFHINHWIGIPNFALSQILSFDKKGGRLGVEFFFILSGFLITYLLFSEQKKFGKINILFFYIRRLLRIWPVYFLTLLIGFFFFPLISGVEEKNSNWLMYSFFLTNFDHILNGPPTIGILGVQWSVAIEEQFYLLWPVLFFFLNRRVFFPFLLFTFLILSEIFYLHTQLEDTGKYHFFSSFRFLVWGCLLAWVCFKRPNLIIGFLNKIKWPLTLAAYVIFIPLMYFNFYIPNLIFNESVPFLFFAFVIAEQNFSPNSFFKIGKFKILTRLGKISYGLYLYHMVSIYLAREIFPEGLSGMWLKGITALGMTILFSHLSYYYFERFFLSLKEKKFTLNKITEYNSEKNSGE